MKAKEVVAEIVGSREYEELVKYWQKVSGDVKLLTTEIWQHINELLDVLSEKIYTERKDFLRVVTRSYRPRHAPENKIRFGAMPNAEAARDAFIREVGKQMPVYVDLLAIIARAEEEKQIREQERIAIVTN